MKKKIDDNGRIRRIIMIQLSKVYKIYQPGTMALLVLTNSLLFIEYFSERNIHPYATVLLVSTTICIILWVAAHIYTRWLNLNEFQHRGEMEFNPYAVNHLTPLDEMRWRTYYLPSMISYYEILKHFDKNNNHLPVLEDKINCIKRWVDLGYIPPEDAPEHLKDLFKSKMELRL